MPFGPGCMWPRTRWCHTSLLQSLAALPMAQGVVVVVAYVVNILLLCKKDPDE
jgi:hypothetical protein